VRRGGLQRRIRAEGLADAAPQVAARGAATARVHTVFEEIFRKVDLERTREERAREKEAACVRAMPEEIRRAMEPEETYQRSAQKYQAVQMPSVQKSVRV